MTDWHHELHPGPVDAVPLVLLHGFTGSSQNWDEHLPAFTVQRPALTIDIIGHGRSPAPTNANAYTMPRAAAEIVNILDALEIEQAALLGYSMGGRLALYTAVNHPARFSHLILESASPGLATDTDRQARRQRDDTLARRIEDKGIPAFVDFWEGLALWRSQAQLPAAKQDALRRQRLANRAVGLANSLRSMGTGVQPSLWPQLAALTLPTLLIVGEHDTKFRAINKQMTDQMPTATLEIVSGAGHTVHLERPSLFQTLVLTFLNTA